MKVEIRLTVQDYLAAQRLHFRPRFFLRSALWLLAGFLLSALGQQIWIIYHHGVLPHWWWLLPTGLAYGGLLFVIFLPWKVGRVFKNNPRLGQPMTVNFSDAGLAVESSGGLVRAPWSSLKFWKHNRRLILIYHSRIHFHIFPRRAFGSGENFKRTLELLRKQLGNERI